MPCEPGDRSPLKGGSSGSDASCRGVIRQQPVWYAGKMPTDVISPALARVAEKVGELMGDRS
jgi:hypothetical protein